MLVVMTDVGREDSFEVSAVHDQEPVETFTTYGADPPFDVCVRARCSYRCADRADVSVRNTSANAAVNLLSRSWIKNRIGAVCSANVWLMFRACWGRPL